VTAIWFSGGEIRQFEDAVFRGSHYGEKGA
jgi:hypothetical protein